MTYDIHPLGGCQNYLSGKCPYLEARGWDVYILYAGVNSNTFEYKNLSNFASKNIPLIDFIPAQLPHFLQKRVISKMISAVSKKQIDYDETVIESHFDKVDLWGALLAEKLCAKHVCFNCNEIFRGSDKFFEKYLDFYWYKYERKELFGITPKSLIQLFNGYNGFSTISKIYFEAFHPPVVEDVNHDIINAIPNNANWTICYIGRILKSYVNRILSDISLFAKDYHDKIINFVIIGDEKPKADLIHKTFENNKNINVIPLGNQIPIPKILFSKFDVIIAGAGSAWAVINENVPIIIPDPKNCLSNGLFRYENKSSITLDKGRKQESFYDTLKRVLVNQEHKNYNYNITWNIPDLDSQYDKHMSMISNTIGQGHYPSSLLLKNDLFINLGFKEKCLLFIELLKREIII